MNANIKGFFSVFVVAVVFFAAWYSYRDTLHRGESPPAATLLLDDLETRGLKDRSLTDINGKVFSLYDLKGKIIIINFWASWCDPCVEEFPSLLKLIDLFGDKVVLIAISGDKTKEDIFDFLRIFKVQSQDNFKVVWDKSMVVAESFGTSVLPESYIFDQKLKLIRKVSGVDNWASPEAIRFFRSWTQKEAIQ